MGGRRSHSCWFSDMFDEVGGGEILSGGLCERGSLHRLERNTCQILLWCDVAFAPLASRNVKLEDRLRLE